MSESQNVKVCFISLQILESHKIKPILLKRFNGVSVLVNVSICYQAMALLANVSFMSSLKLLPGMFQPLQSDTQMVTGVSMWYETYSKLVKLIFILTVVSVAP